MDTATSGLIGPLHARVEGAPRSRHGESEKPVRFSTLAAALDWVLGMFERYGLVTGWLSSTGTTWRAVHVIRVRETELLLVGNTCPDSGPVAAWEPDPAAERSVARLLPARGYHRLDLPEPGTPLETLRPLLPSRTYNCLHRYGYHSVEQVAALPDVALYDMRTMGAASIARIRAAIAGLGATARPAAPTTLTAQQAGDLAMLLADLADLARAHDAGELAERAAAFQQLLPRPGQGDHRGDVAADRPADRTPVAQPGQW